MVFRVRMSTLSGALRGGVRRHGAAQAPASVRAASSGGGGSNNSAKRGAFAVTAGATAFGAYWFWRDSPAYTEASKPNTLSSAGLSRMHSVNITGWSFGSSEKIKLPSKHYPYIIVAHPRAVVTQSALNILQEEDPHAPIFVVADRYNFDNGEGSRLYTSRIHTRDTGASSQGMGGRQGDRRENISTFTASGSKLDAELLPSLEGFQPSPKVEMCLTAHVVSLDTANKTVELSDGRIISFGRCLLATGCREAKLPGIPPGLEQHVTNLRKVKDFERVQQMVSEGAVKRIVVVGGGFLGCEVASKLAALAKIKKKVEVVHAYVEPGALYRYVPVYFSDYVTERLRSLGVTEKPYHMVLSIKEPADKKGDSNVQLVLQGFEKEALDCGHVIFAPTHLEGNVELAEQAGLEIDTKCGGVLVNAEMLARSDIYVAGDTASYPDRNLGRRRMQSYDHSFHSGALAAMNMVRNGRQEYTHLPIITSQGGPLGLDIVVLGDLDSSMEMYSIAQTSGSQEDTPCIHQARDDDSNEKKPPVHWGTWERGVVYYLKNRQVVGAMLLNASAYTGEVKDLIRAGNRYDHRSERGLTDLEKAIDYKLRNTTYRHSTARGT
mmetsp:Transcript_16549/g.39052  ORF Transcript_16549/g.39052 Transcript_16549/m.39052 type:complete len:607 (+) Transcript_16549:51-1871(+)